MERKLKLPTRPGVVAMLSKEFHLRKYKEWQFSLVGKYKDDWVPQPNVTDQVLRKMWNLSGKMDTLLFPDSRYVFKLDNSTDMENILKGGPYTVQGSFLMLQKLPPSTKVEHVRFDKVPVWVTICDLPMHFYDEEVALALGQYMGRVVGVEVVSGDFARKSLMRVRVEIEAEEALLCGSYVDDGNGGMVWASFMYENIPKLCRNCMVIGHLEHECMKTPFQAKMELAKRLENMAKKMMVPVVSDPTPDLLFPTPTPMSITGPGRQARRIGSNTGQIVRAGSDPLDQHQKRGRGQGLAQAGEFELGRDDNGVVLGTGSGADIMGLLQFDAEPVGVGFQQMGPESQNPKCGKRKKSKVVQMV